MKTPIDKACIQAAKEKRARRAERNIRWWANDKTWEFSRASQG